MMKLRKKSLKVFTYCCAFIVIVIASSTNAAKYEAGKKSTGDVVGHHYTAFFTGLHVAAKYPTYHEEVRTRLGGPQKDRTVILVDPDTHQPVPLHHAAAQEVAKSYAAAMVNKVSNHGKRHPDNQLYDISNELLSNTDYEHLQDHWFGSPDGTEGPIKDQIDRQLTLAIDGGEDVRDGAKFRIAGMLEPLIIAHMEHHDALIEDNELHEPDFAMHVTRLLSSNLLIRNDTEQQDPHDLHTELATYFRADVDGILPREVVHENVPPTEQYNLATSLKFAASSTAVPDPVSALFYRKPGEAPPLLSELAVSVPNARRERTAHKLHNETGFHTSWFTPDPSAWSPTTGMLQDLLNQVRQKYTITFNQSDDQASRAMTEQLVFSKRGQTDEKKVVDIIGYPGTGGFAEFNRSNVREMIAWMEHVVADDATE